MRAVDIIQKKKEGKEHTKEEIYFLVNGYTKGEIEDYQMSAWLMAVCFQGLSDVETAYLTESFVDSGDVLDFSDFDNSIFDVKLSWLIIYENGDLKRYKLSFSIHLIIYISLYR